MKNIYLLTIFLCCYLYGLGQTCYTPTGVAVSCERLTETYDSAEIAAGNAYYDSLINANGWSAIRLSDCSSIYNCHGYAWHMSDDGDTIRLPNDSDVAKYCTGESATYTVVDGSEREYVKVYYNGAQHSAIVHPNIPSRVISKWGNGPLVNHLPHDNPYIFKYTYTLEYYKLIINESPSSVEKSCATDVSTLNINNASYSWSGDNNYVCAAGSTYTGEVTGLNTTSGSTRGKVMVEIESSYSGTTVKGIKELQVTSAPSAPYITGTRRLVCSGGESFTLHNIPSGNTFTWTSSSNLSTSNPTANPCTFVSTGNGSGWVKATLSTDCYETIVSFDVWSGAPVISSIDGPQGAPNNYWAYYSAELESSLSAPTDYNWILSPLNGNYVYEHGANGINVNCDILFSSTGNYQLIVQAQNTCSAPGFGPYYVRGIYVYNSYYIMISPNPTTGETTLSIESNTEESGLKSASTEPVFDENAEWELEIYSPNQALKEKRTKLKGKNNTNPKLERGGLCSACKI